MYPYIIEIDIAMTYISAIAGTWYITIGSERSIMAEQAYEAVLEAWRRMIS
jgi:hypothetical protein